MYVYRSASANEAAEGLGVIEPCFEPLLFLKSCSAGSLRRRLAKVNHLEGCKCRCAFGSTRSLRSCSHFLLSAVFRASTPPRQLETPNLICWLACHVLAACVAWPMSCERLVWISVGLSVPRSTSNRSSPSSGTWPNCEEDREKREP